jgi:hypothetical protein
MAQERGKKKRENLRGKPNYYKQNARNSRENSQITYNFCRWVAVIYSYYAMDFLGPKSL